MWGRNARRTMRSALPSSKVRFAFNKARRMPSVEAVSRQRRRGASSGARLGNAASSGAETSSFRQLSWRLRSRNSVSSSVSIWQSGQPQQGLSLMTGLLASEAAGKWDFAKERDKLSCVDRRRRDRPGRALMLAKEHGGRGGFLKLVLNT